MRKCYDVGVIGATAAGLSAAIELARAKRSVVVLDIPATPTESPLADWVPRDVFQLAPFLKPIAKAAGAEPFEVVRFHNADGTKSAEYKAGKIAGYSLPAGKLQAALKAAARKLKVAFVTGHAWPLLQLGEQKVTLIGEHTTEMQLLMIAQDRPADVMSELALPVRNVPRSTLTVSGLDVHWTPGKLRNHFPPELHVVDLPTRGELGMFFPAGNTLHVRIISDRPAGGNRADELSSMLNMMQKTGLLPKTMPFTNVRGGVWHPPAGVALELETHVAKRTLLIGTSGGFAGMMTGQTISPSIRSALLAAEVAQRALDSTDTQNALGVFKSEWRLALADYLRPPNTSLHLLLPLLFVNKQMVTRFARSMLYGEPM